MSPRAATHVRGMLSGGGALGLAILLLAAPAAAATTTTPQPTPVPEATTTAEPVTTEVPEAPTEPLPTPRNNQLSLGQSLQIRVNADGEPNSSLTDFRWSVNQLTVVGEESGETEVPVPDRGSLLRSLLDFSRPPQQDGIATLSTDVQDGFGLARTVSLFPQDEQPPVSLDVAFTLDGEPVTAAQLVGRSGVVTAQYTLTNLSTQPYDVTVKDLQGNPVTQTVEADVPMVAIAKTLLPQRYTGLATGSGQFGADGRGNNQVQWVALPFRPITEDGTSTFGWAANVTDAVIPSLLIQVAPVYLPAHGDDPTTEAVESTAGGAALGVPPPNLDPAVAEIQAGVASIIAGLEGFAASGGGPDPLTALEGKLNTFFTTFGTNLQTIATLVDPANPSGATALVRQLNVAITEALPKLQAVEDNLGKLQAAADLLTPEQAQALADLAGPINQLADYGPQLQLIADNAATIATGIRAGCLDPPGDIGPSLPPEVCANKDQLIAILESPQLQQAAATVNSPQFQAGADALAVLGPQLPQLDATLDALVVQLPGTINTLQVILPQLQGVLTSLDSALTGLSEQLTIIGGGLAEADVELPTVDEVVADITTAVLQSPNGQLLTAGVSQAKTGVGAAKTELANFAAQLVVAVKGVATTTAGVAGDTNTAVVAAKSSIAGLVAAAGQSPLPYGGDPANAPPGTVLAGAYEFRVDAADTNQPNTAGRVIVGLLALLAAGGLSSLVAHRAKGDGAREAEAATEAGEQQPVGAAVGAGAAVGSGAAAGSDHGRITPEVSRALEDPEPGPDAEPEPGPDAEAQ